MKIQVQLKNVYGNTTIYPICDKAKLFAALVGQKTLTARDIKHIKDLGYSVDVIQETVSL